MRPLEYQAPLAGSFKGDSPIDVARETLAGLSFFCYLCSWTSFCSYVKLTCFHGVVRACMYFLSLAMLNLLPEMPIPTHFKLPSFCLFLKAQFKDLVKTFLTFPSKIAHTSKAVLRQFLF